MYVKVHKEGNQWVRDDNGALLGEVIDKFRFCVKIKDINYPIVTGYLDENKFFIPSCTIDPKRCLYGCVYRYVFKHIDTVCPSLHSKDPTYGYYAKLPYYIVLNTN